VGLGKGPVVYRGPNMNPHVVDRLLAAAGVRPRVLAEVDDMAMLRLLAREGEGLCLVPPVVVRDEIESGALVERNTYWLRRIADESVVVASPVPAAKSTKKRLKKSQELQLGDDVKSRETGSKRL
jgi:DNA-binding transcriptional LysR family regulator